MTVDRKDYIEIYNLIPVKKRNEATTLMGFRYPYRFTIKRQIDIFQYDQLIKYCVDEGYKSNNSILGYVTFDAPQVMDYYKSLLNLINSDEWKLYSHKNQTRIINEQIKIRKSIKKWL